MSSRALPMLAECALDEDGARRQLERYRQAGRGATLIAHTRRRLTVELDARVAPELVEELLATERACCPFFKLTWEPGRRRLGFAVRAAAHEPALEQISLALGGARPAR
jgi:hypothetical protein